eukprot:8628812-Pyramimonas_sp.AAC.1
MQPLCPRSVLDQTGPTGCAGMYCTAALYWNVLYCSTVLEGTVLVVSTHAHGVGEIKIRVHSCAPRLPNLERGAL